MSRIDRVLAAARDRYRRLPAEQVPEFFTTAVQWGTENVKSARRRFS